MKGGYQILDLTGATADSPVEVKGIYKAASGNNGKPVMILTNDGQRVYAEIAEDGDDFVTCYISAEGKTVIITIEPDDSVTTVVSDPGSSITELEQAVNEIAGNIGDVEDLTTTSKEVVGAVNELNSNLSELITTQDFSTTYSAGASTYGGVYNFDVSKSGYTPLGIIAIDNRDSNCFLYNYKISGNAAQIVFRNITSAPISDTNIDFRVLYIKDRA